MRRIEAGDPFALTADTRLYVPRPASERALATLEEALRKERRPLVITGPSGLGKTLLLHMLAERSGRSWHPFHLQYGALSPDELCCWLLSTLGEDKGGPPREAMRELVEVYHESGHALLLLVDDASGLPIETARWLGDLALQCDGRLGLVLAAGDHAGTGSRLAALGDVVQVRLSEPMSEAETAEYLIWRLARCGVPANVRARFSPAVARRLHAIAGGNPRRLHIAAADLLRGGQGEVPEDLFASLAEESRSGKDA